jgi:preprotein translocase subunit SecA
MIQPAPDPQGGSTPSLLRNWFQGPSAWRLAAWSRLVGEVATIGEGFRALSDAQLRKESLSLRYRAKSGERMQLLLPTAFALVRESASRTLNMRHFDVQLLGGMALFHGCIAEMETGEGKTLTATLAMYLRALSGKGALLATVNDYLAHRDAEWMRPVYELLAMKVGVIQTEMDRNQRRSAYACDITYGTAKEFGFDFLRDRLLIRRLQQENVDIFGGPGNDDAPSDRPVQRDPYFALVDEADSVLIDDARTPLIISSIAADSEQVEAAYRWSALHCAEYEEDRDFEYDQEKKKVELTAQGRHKVRLLPYPEEMSGMGLIDAYEFIERAIKVRRDFHRDQHYVVTEKGEIVIVDESTGRLAEGRKWRDGIHQAIEAKEQVDVTLETGQAARITVQDFFMRFRHLAGMTGTAVTSAREFRKVYRTHVVKIPTNRPSRRQQLASIVAPTGDDKWEAIAAEIRDLHRQGRPVLIGTRTIEKSEILSKLLHQLQIPHQVLNAHKIAEEAAIVAEAGRRGRVTVATNMAGRGTDIKLGEGVPELGGLHVICTEIHDSARIDRQLIGRCGRQGDPGSYRQYQSLDDDVLESGYGRKRARNWFAKGKQMRSEALGSYAPLFRRAQRRVERQQLRQRMILLYHEQQRKRMQEELGQDPYLDTPH